MYGDQHDITPRLAQHTDPINTSALSLPAEETMAGENHRLTKDDYDSGVSPQVASETVEEGIAFRLPVYSA